MDANIALANWRSAVDVSQATMAMAMNLPLRTYEDIEAGRSQLRPIHVSAAKLALLRLAVERGRPELLNLDPEVAQLVRSASKLLD